MNLPLLSGKCLFLLCEWSTVWLSALFVWLCYASIVKIFHTLFWKVLKTRHGYYPFWVRSSRTHYKGGNMLLQSKCIVYVTWKIQPRLQLSGIIAPALPLSLSARDTVPQKAWFELGLSGKNWEFQKQERNYSSCINARALKKKEAGDHDTTNFRLNFKLKYQDIRNSTTVINA